MQMLGNFKAKENLYFRSPCPLCLKNVSAPLGLERANTLHFWRFTLVSSSLTYGFFMQMGPENFFVSFSENFSQKYCRISIKQYTHKILASNILNLTKLRPQRANKFISRLSAKKRKSIK